MPEVPAHFLFKPVRAVLLLLLIIAFASMTGAQATTRVARQVTQDPTGQQRPRRVGKEESGAKGAQPGQTPEKSQGEEVDAGDVVRVETQMVSVPAVVYDGAGRPLVTLKADNFTLFEDGRPQQITNFSTTDAPFEVALLLDTSGSTRADVGLIRRAANSFIDALRPGDKVSIVAFNTAHEGRTQLATVDIVTQLTSDRKILRKALENIGASSGTPYYDALEKIANQVFRDPPPTEMRGRRAVVALTDGVDSASLADYADARERFLHSGVACYFIEVNTEDFVEDRLMKDCQDDGRLTLSKTQLDRYHRIFNPRADAADYSDFCLLGPFEKMQMSRQLYELARREMNDLARVSGGKTFVARDLRDSRLAFAQVATEIGTQYSLGYYSTNKTRDGRFRTIRVETRLPGINVQVRAREGYYAPKG